MNRYGFKSLLIGLCLLGTHCFSAPDSEVLGWITQGILVPWALWASNMNVPEASPRIERTRSESMGMWSGLAIWESMALYNIVRPSIGKASDLEVIAANFILANCALAASLYFPLTEDSGEKGISWDLFPTRYGVGTRLSLNL